MLHLNCAVQNYAWGKTVAKSEVAKLSGAKDEGKSTKFAELWMGTHPKGPSRIVQNKLLLSEFLSANREWMGDKLNSDAENGQLPFLLKVLSVGSALSVQVHPTKEQAVELHKKDAKNYPDSNHKPEMAIALTEFEVLCGFRSRDELVSILSVCPEEIRNERLISDELLENLKNSSSVSQEKTALRDIFRVVVSAPADQISSVVLKFVEFVKSDVVPKELLPVKEVIQRLNSEQSGDVGVLAPLFLNHFVLSPGEASFLGPNEPHAYLSGDCVECMACSDNTIRAGLTPKVKDVDTLFNCLTYRMSSIDSNRFSSFRHEHDPFVTVYRPPCPEFAVHKIEIRNVAENSEYSFLELKVCSILIVVSGCCNDVKIGRQEKGNSLKRGDVVVISANAGLRGEIDISSGDFLAFRAFCPSN